MGLQALAFRLFKWFENNRMKAIPGKLHRKRDEVKINDVVLTLSVEEKLLGITLDSDL